MQKVRTYFNHADLGVKGERFTLPSCTVPDQTLSIQEIMRRYAKGLPIGGQKVELFDEEDDLPDPRTLDLAERQEYAEIYVAEIKDYNKRQKEAAQKAADIALKAKQDAEGARAAQP